MDAVAAGGDSEADKDRVELRKLLPRSLRDRSMGWAVWLNGQQVGLLQQWSHSGRRGSSTIFYRASATDHRDGRWIALESSPNRQQQIERIITVHRDPDSFLHGTTVGWPYFTPPRK